MIRQAITTKYCGPTNTRGARIKASAQAGSVFSTWDDALGADDNHVAAAKAFALRWGWKWDLQTGVLPNGDYVHMFVAE